MVGSAQPTPCLPGSIAPAANTEMCDQCSDGNFQREYGQTSCTICIPGFFCKTGTAEPVPCPAGYFGNATGLYSPGQCTPAPINFWAPLGSIVPEQCPPSGFYCPGTLRDDLYGGAKPIIMPIGQSTKTQEVSTVELTMTLDISIDDFAAQREALIEGLAEQYDVNASLVTLEASAMRRRARALQDTAGVELTITIATSDGAGASVHIDEIEDRVAAVDDTALASTIGSVLGVPVTVKSKPPQRSTALIEVTFSCPKGKWCTAGLVVPCPLGSCTPVEIEPMAAAAARSDARRFDTARCRLSRPWVRCAQWQTIPWRIRTLRRHASCARSTRTRARPTRRAAPTASVTRIKPEAPHNCCCLTDGFGGLAVRLVLLRGCCWLGRRCLAAAGCSWLTLTAVD